MKSISVRLLEKRWQAIELRVGRKHIIDPITPNAILYIWIAVSRNSQFEELRYE